MYFVELKSCNIQESLNCGGFCCATNAPTADWCNSDFDFNVDADIDVDVGVDVDVDVDVDVEHNLSDVEKVRQDILTLC